MTMAAIGILAAVLSVVSFLPQAWQVIKTRRTAELATMRWNARRRRLGLWGSA